MSDERLKFFLENRLKRLESIKDEREWTTAELGDIACCKQTLEFIDSLQKEPVSESIDFEQELYKAFGQIKDFTLGIAIAKRFYDMGRKHAEEQMMAKAVDARCFGFQGAALFSFRLPADKYLVGSEVKVVVIKEE